MTRQEKGRSTICRNNPSGALHKLHCSPLIALLWLAAPILADGPATTQPARTPDDELIDRLIRGDQAGGSTFSRILDAMGVAHVQLVERFDPGDKTQRLQRQVVADLDDLIDRMRQGMKLTPPTTQQASDSQPPQPRPADDQPAAGDGANGTRPRQGDPTGTGQLGGELREGRLGWGRLPSRDRKEVLQGIGQEVLLKYREWIERYYRALGDAATE